MFEHQPNEVVVAVLRGLESSVCRALPRGTFVSSARAYCGGYDMTAEWPVSTARSNRQGCTLAVRFSLTGAKAHCRLDHSRQGEICRRVSEWLYIQLESQHVGLRVDTSYDLMLTAPNAFFLGERDAIQVDREGREHDFSLHRDASLPPLG